MLSLFGQAEGESAKAALTLTHVAIIEQRQSEVL
jgi:hypothetical protein